MARRAGVPLELEDLDRIGRTTPVIANIRPSGATYLMEDFFYAGACGADEAAWRQAGSDRYHRQASRSRMGLDDVKIWNEDVIRPLSNPVYHEGSLAVLKGNLCPDGAVIKPAACDPKFHRTRSGIGGRQLSGTEEDYRRSRLSTDAGNGAGAAQCRAAGRTGNAEWGNPDAESAFETRPAGHGADFRCQHVGNEFRGLRAARAHRKLCRWTAGPVENRGYGGTRYSGRSLNMLVPDDELAARKAAWVSPSRSSSGAMAFCSPNISNRQTRAVTSISKDRIRCQSV